MNEEQQADATQQMQNKVDRLKLLNLTSNIHSLTPPQPQRDNNQDNVALVIALKVSPRLAEAVLFFQGRMPTEKDGFVQITEPIMNIKGVWAFINGICRVISENTEWATYSEDELPTRLIHYYESNLPNFIFNKEKFELKSENFNQIETYLQIFIDSAFHKAKQGKYINTLGRTYSEDLLNKALSTEQQKQSKQNIIERFLNPQPRR
jgi:hypothetical protein